MKSWVRLFEAGMRGGDAEVTPTTIEAWAVDIAGMNVLEEDLKRLTAPDSPPPPADLTSLLPPVGMQVTCEDDPATNGRVVQAEVRGSEMLCRSCITIDGMTHDFRFAQPPDLSFDYDGKVATAVLTLRSVTASPPA